jgi:hypothetical protein
LSVDARLGAVLYYAIIEIRELNTFVLAVSIVFNKFGRLVNELSCDLQYD